MGDISWADSELLKNEFRTFVDEIKTHITNERAILMSQLNDAIDELVVAYDHQIDQIKAGLQTTIDNLQGSLTQAQSSEMDAETRAAQAEAARDTAITDLQTLQNDMTGGLGKIQSKVDQLREDDEPPAPEPAPEPPAAQARSSRTSKS